MTLDEAEAQHALKGTPPKWAPPADGAVWVRIMQEGEDAEIHTMLHCASVIERLDPAQRKRVAQYLAVRFS